jgi:hypothetical protein
MTNLDVRELNTAELEQVSGAVSPGYHYCPIGTTNSGEGVYPDYIPCATTTWGQLWERIRQTVQNGGRPA